MQPFEPDYTQLQGCAWNKEAKRLPLYEHNVSFKLIGEIIGKDIKSLYDGNDKDLDEFFSAYCGFFKDNGYDVVTFEQCIGPAMPGSGTLGNSALTPAIQTAEDFKKYPWEEVPELYFKMSGRYFEALRRNLPAGMKAIGGVGNGIFECVQDVVGFENLCFIKADEPEVYEEVFEKVAETNYAIWQRFMKEYGDIYCVLRFGDDLGFKHSTLLSPADVKSLIIPKYRRFTDLVHSYNKPFLLHSCGCIFDVMDDILNIANIDAKHSNEDQIAPFYTWVEKYGDKIGNFGGIDTDAVCRLDKTQMKEYITDVIKNCSSHGGFAFGSGNSIPDYVPAENYINMINIVRELRGDSCS